mmetsp:Transcript_234/g.456  ORF Transcript_234/g.456 Transcript_234/m.456 type:complete len:246 (-) Transcript_234:2249-2986(-)
MRRRVGVGGALKAKRERQAFQDKGAQLTESNLDYMQEQMKQFKKGLEDFAVKHKKQINKDPEFRSKFQAMCTKIGVDPLASNKGFWAEILGVGTFYYELGVQTVHVCLATRDSNGGIMRLDDLVAYLKRVRPKSADNQAITEDDVKRAVDTLEPLGNGLRLMQIGTKKMLVSVPMELSSDHTCVLDLASQSEPKGVVNKLQLQDKLKWGIDRCDRVLSGLQSQGIAWVDGPSGDYWIPGIALSLI